MDLYNASKIFYIKFKSFSQYKPGIFKNFHRLSLVRLPYVVTNVSAVRCFKLSAVRVSEISAALSAVSVNEMFKF